MFSKIELSFLKIYAIILFSKGNIDDPTKSMKKLYKNLTRPSATLS
jgi:hypothetical protein